MDMEFTRKWAAWRQDYGTTFTWLIENCMGKEDVAVHYLYLKVSYRPDEAVAFFVDDFNVPTRASAPELIHSMGFEIPPGLPSHICPTPVYMEITNPPPGPPGMFRALLPVGVNMNYVQRDPLNTMRIVACVNHGMDEKSIGSGAHPPGTTAEGVMEEMEAAMQFMEKMCAAEEETMKDLESMSVKELKAFITSKGGSYAGLLEKPEFVQAARELTQNKVQKELEDKIGKGLPSFDFFHK